MNGFNAIHATVIVLTASVSRTHNTEGALQGWRERGEGLQLFDPRINFDLL
jgi:hypothetical protein